MIKGDADYRAEVTRLAALLGIAGQVHFALGRAVADEAGRHVVFRNHDPERGMPVDIDDSGIGLPPGPRRGEQLGLHDVRRPSIRPRLAVAHQLGWRSNLDLRLALRPRIEVLADETG